MIQLTGYTLINQIEAHIIMQCALLTWMVWQSLAWPSISSSAGSDTKKKRGNTSRLLSRYLHTRSISFLPRCMKCRRGVAMRILSVRPSVRPSVRLSVRHTRDSWQNGRKIGPDFYTIRKNIYPSFLRRRMVGRGRPLLREILCQPTPVGTKSPIFNQ